MLILGMPLDRKIHSFSHEASSHPLFFGCMFVGTPDILPGGINVIGKTLGC
jgi:hypothetical protein